MKSSFDHAFLYPDFSFTVKIPLELSNTPVRMSASAAFLPDRMGLGVPGVGDTVYYHYLQLDPTPHTPLVFLPRETTSFLLGTRRG